MSISCPRCGAAADPEDRFCGECGSLLSPTVSQEAIEAHRGREQRPVPEQTPTLPKAEPVHIPASAPAKRRGWFRRLVATVALLIVTALALLWWTGDLPVLLRRAGLPEFGRPAQGEMPPADAASEAEAVVEVAGRQAREAMQLALTRTPSYRLPEDEIPPASQPTQTLVEEVETPAPRGVEVALPGGGDRPPADDRTLTTKEEASVTIRIVTEPPGATLFVDGVEIGITPAEVGIDPNVVYQIRLTLQGYEDFEMPLDPEQWGIGFMGTESVATITIPMEPGGGNGGARQVPAGMRKLSP